MSTRIENDEMVLTVETFTPEECQLILEDQNGKNRPITEAHVERLAKDAAADKWPLTHQGIAFGPDGDLLDGQHRIAAHVRARKNFVTVVCRYKSAAHAEQAMLLFDAGRARAASDALVIGGVMSRESAREASALCVVLDALAGRGSSQNAARDRVYLAEFYREHRAAVDWAISALPEKRFAAHVRAPFALGWYVDRVRSGEFAAQIREGVALSGSASALWNRAWTDGLLTPKGSGLGSRKEAALRALRIVKVYLTGERPPERLFASEEVAAWFRERMPGAKLDVADPLAGLSLKERIVRVLGDGHPRRAAEIAPMVRGNLETVKTMLTQLAISDRISRVERGVYTLNGVGTARAGG